MIEYLTKNNVIPFTNMVKQAMENLRQGKVSIVNQLLTTSNDPLEQLERLASLKEKCVITEEFQEQKTKILG